MKICITGACGYLGSALIPALLKDGHDITGVDNFLTQRYASLFPLATGRPIRFIDCDVLACDLPNLFLGADVIIHLAAITDAATTVGREAETFETNYIGTMQVYEAAKDVGAWLIFPSSTSVYGVNQGEVDETCEEFTPQSPYAASKLEAEKFLLSRNHVKSTIMRMGTVYGVSPGWRPHTFVNKASLEAALGKPITIWKTAMHQKRPYLALEDYVSATRHILSHDLTGLYCVVSGNHTPFDVVTILKHHRPNLTVKTTTSVIMNQQSYSTSAKKLISTGWHPQGDLATGIAQTLALLGGVHG